MKPSEPLHPDLDLIRRAMRREGPACRTLVDRLTPSIQKHVNAALIKRRRGTREDVRDLTQEIFRILLENDGAALRAWVPHGGATLEGWAALIAERKVSTILDSGRRSGHAEYVTEQDVLEAHRSPAPTPERTAASREELEQLLGLLEASLSDEAYAIFVWLFVEQRDTEWMMENAGLSRDSVYAWRSRLQKRGRKILSEIRSDSWKSSGRVIGEASP